MADFEALNNCKLRKTCYFENCGIKVPKGKGGGFLPGMHESGIYSLYQKTRDFYKEYLAGNRKTFVSEWYIERNASDATKIRPEKLVLSEKDILAYEKFGEYVIDKTNSPFNGFNTFKDFFSDYLICSRIGTVAFENWKAISTANFRPYTNFEPWIREGFDVYSSFLQYDFDPKKKMFFQREPSSAQYMAEMEKKDRLEQELGRKL